AADLERWSAIAPGEPLFETLFVFEELQVDTAEPERLSDVHRAPRGASERPECPRTITCVAGAASLAISARYDEGRFDDASMARLLGHYRTLIDSIAHDGPTCVGDLELLPAEEAHRLVSHANATQRAFGAARCVHELFEEQATRTPDAVALED